MNKYQAVSSFLKFGNGFFDALALRFQFGRKGGSREVIKVSASVSETGGRMVLLARDKATGELAQVSLRSIQNPANKEQFGLGVQVKVGGLVKTLPRRMRSGGMWGTEEDLTEELCRFRLDEIEDLIDRGGTYV